MKRILVMGLPGAGKTTLAQQILEHLQNERKTVMWLNADDVRKKYNDWDFSHEGRIRQSLRMRELADSYNVDYVICDFVAPLVEMRNNFKADWTIWVDTINQGRFEDTNKMFERPSNADVSFISHNLDAEAKASRIIDKFNLHDWSAPTTLMLGRYQPWHEGHHALYKEAGKRTEQVLLGVRNTYNTSEKDPLKFDQVKEYIAKDEFMDGALVLRLPNITNIVYGRDVGYKIEQVDLGADIHAISATQKRKEMGI